MHTILKVLFKKSRNEKFLCYFRYQKTLFSFLFSFCYENFSQLGSDIILGSQLNQFCTLWQSIRMRIHAYSHVLALIFIFTICFDAIPSSLCGNNNQINSVPHVGELISLSSSLSLGKREIRSLA